MADAPETLQFSLLDELFYHLETPENPFTNQMEVRVNQRLDGSQLAEALLTAMRLHPLVRARMAPWSASDRHYRWEIPDVPAQVPLFEMTCADEAALDEARSQLHSQGLSLQDGGPLRCLLAHCDDGDYLMINCSQAVSDGIGVYRFVTSVLRAYAKVPDPQTTQTLADVRDLAGRFGSRSLRERINRIGRLVEILGTAITPPRRIAGEGGSDEPGLGFVPVRFNREQTARLHTLRRDGATLNDVLQALLHQAIAQWNREHGTSDGRVSVMMPMNTRQADWRYEIVSNLSLWVNVVSRPEDQTSFDTLLQRIAAQTSRLKERGTAGLLIDLLNDISALPVRIKQRLPALLPLTGHRIVDTTILNNLGRLENPLPDKHKLQVRELAFSSPCRSPMGLSVGAATLDEQLRLSFRYQNQQFSNDGAWAFVEHFLDNIQRELGSQ